MHDDLYLLDRQISATIAGLSAAQTQTTPIARPHKWSIQQIIEHLLQTYRASTPAIQTRLNKGHPTLAVPSTQQRAGQFLLITLGLFPHGRLAPADVSPPASAAAFTGDDLAEHVHRELVQLDQLFDRGERQFGKVRAATHMILGPLAIRQWRRFHLVHGKHHVKQIRVICQERSF